MNPTSSKISQVSQTDKTESLLNIKTCISVRCMQGNAEGSDVDPDYQTSRRELYKNP